MTFESEDVMGQQGEITILNLPSYLSKKNDLYEEHHVEDKTYITILDAVAHFETRDHTAKQIVESRDLWEIVNNEQGNLHVRPITSPKQAQKILREIIKTESIN